MAIKTETAALETAPTAEEETAAYQVQHNLADLIAALKPVEAE